MITVYSKIELSEPLKQKIETYVRTTTAGEATNQKIHFKLDATIISGIRINVNSHITDLTLNARLEKILGVF